MRENLLQESFSAKVTDRRTFIVGATTLALGGLFAACNSGPSTSTPTNKQYKIALIPGIDHVPFYEMVRKGAEDEARKQNTQILYQAPQKWDPALQSPIVDAMVAQKVDAILISPCDNHALISSLQKANDAGVKVVTIDTALGDGDYAKGDVKFPVAYIGSDNLKGGQLAGEVLIRAIGGKGKVYVQSLQPGASTTDQREQGFRNAIAKTNGAVQVLNTQYDGGDQNKATTQASDVIQKNSDLAGIFGTTAYSAEGAANAVKNLGKSGEVKVVHFDASEQAITDLRNGIVDFIIGQLPRDMGRIGVQYAVKALNGATDLQKHVGTDFIVIDHTNVDTPQSQAAVYRV